jgi:hypothetical protein
MELRLLVLVEKCAAKSAIKKKLLNFHLLGVTFDVDDADDGDDGAVCVEVVVGFLVLPLPNGLRNRRGSSTLVNTKRISTTDTSISTSLIAKAADGCTYISSISVSSLKCAHGVN